MLSRKKRGSILTPRTRSPGQPQRCLAASKSQVHRFVIVVEASPHPTRSTTSPEKDRWTLFSEVLERPGLGVPRTPGAGCRPVGGRVTKTPRSRCARAVSDRRGSLCGWCRGRGGCDLGAGLGRDARRRRSDGASSVRSEVDACAADRVAIDRRPRADPQGAAARVLPDGGVPDHGRFVDTRTGRVHAQRAVRAADRRASRALLLNRGTR